MKKLFIIVIIAIVLMSACSKKLETKLRINNETSADVWITVNDGVQQTIVPNSFKDYSWLLNSGAMTGDETRTVSVKYNGFTVFAADTTITLNAGDFKTLDIYPNGGCIEIQNNSEDFSILEVYISPSDSLYWGDNLLIDDDGIVHKIKPGKNQTWTCSANTWDIMLVDDYGDDFEKMNVDIGIDEIYVFPYTGFKKVSVSHKKKGGIIKGVEKN